MSLMLDSGAEVLGEKHWFQPGQFPGKDVMKTILQVDHTLIRLALSLGGRRQNGSSRWGSSSMCSQSLICRSSQSTLFRTQDSFLINVFTDNFDLLQDSFYGNFNKGRRPSQDTAWGRRWWNIIQTSCAVPRVFDQYEIDIEMTKHRHSYINSGIMWRTKDVKLITRGKSPIGQKRWIYFRQW